MASTAAPVVLPLALAGQGLCEDLPSVRGDAPLPDETAEANLHRALHVAPVVRAYADANGLLDSDVPTAVKDMVSDLCHLLAALGYDALDELERARSRFVDELHGEP